MNNRVEIDTEPMWIKTWNLRFVERQVTDLQNAGFTKPVRVLQQKFTDAHNPSRFEWRDVPLEVEEKGETNG